MTTKRSLFARIARAASLAGAAWCLAAAPATGAEALYHMRARTYDPASARFHSRDPLEAIDPQSVNPYQAFIDDPLHIIDPMGLFAFIDQPSRYGTVPAAPPAPGGVFPGTPGAASLFFDATLGFGPAGGSTEISDDGDKGESPADGWDRQGPPPGRGKAKMPQGGWGPRKDKPKDPPPPPTPPPTSPSNPAYLLLWAPPGGWPKPQENPVVPTDELDWYDATPKGSRDSQQNPEKAKCEEENG